MMRVISRSMTFAGLLAAGMGASAFAQTGAAAAAATAPTGATKVAVINFQAAVLGSNEGQRDMAELRQKFEPKQTQLKNEADSIDALKKQLQTSGSTLSDAERQTKLKQIDEKEKEYQRNGEDAQNDFQGEMQESYQQLAEKVFAVLNSYAKDNGYGLVLDASAGQQQQLPTVLWANQGADITKAVVDAYNAKSGVPAPAPSAPTPAKPAAAPRTAPKQ
ncbi:OmpH family outer membrane protein [Silvibacterium sp.]|uniref:OmpH family outer membrane protein n=1 Tax=Silvibacterium sp. TaxID=1964179 RepID=UPI0039E231A1